MGKIISVANQKGGVGKTTTTVNLSAGLGQLGKKVLVVDIDPQGNTTSGYGVDKRAVTKSTYDILVDDVSPAEVIVETEFSGVDILPANLNLAGVEIEIIEQDARHLKLKKALDTVKAHYDYIIIDCPPSLGLITINAFCASDSVLVPIQCEFFALEGLSQLMSTVKRVKTGYNPSLEVEGVLLTMYDGRLNLTQQVVSEVKRFFPRKVFKSVIPRAVRISEAPSFGRPVMYYDKSSKGSKAYLALAKEVCGR